MAALDFPASPTVGQIYTANGRSWKWDGVSWISANQITSIGVTGSTLTIYGSPIAHPDATSMTFANSVTLTAASTKTLTLNGGAGSNGLVIDASNNVCMGAATGLGTFNKGFYINSGAGSYAGIQLYNTAYSSGAYVSISNADLNIFNANSTGNILFGTNNAVKATLDSAGNLGLGVTPSAWSGLTASQIRYASLSSGGADLYLSANVYYNANWKYATTGVASQYIQYNGAHTWFTAASGTAGNAISFTQAMTLDASGNLLLNQTASPSFSLMAGTTKNSTTNVSFQWGPSTNAGATGVFYVLNSAGVGVYLASGATAWTANSDERLKTNLKPIENAAQKVSTLRAVTGRYKTDDEGVSRSFLIAQDVQAVLPEAVDASDPDKLGVQYTDTIPLLVAAIKELSAEIETLKQRIK